MTITHRKRNQLPDEVQAVNEPGLEYRCDGCDCDLTHSVRIKCADPVCEGGEGIDICPACFCAGKEFRQHKRGHPYRVVELYSYPIFVEDWGADEELLLLEGVSLQGLGNWQAVAEHIGTRTKEEVEQHYNLVYINSPNWPLPRMDVEFDVDPEVFQDNKRRRIKSMNSIASIIKPAPTSAPGVHEIATFLPGRLEFEHEMDNEAEDLVKDLEIGLCMEYGGDQIAVDENDNDMVARRKLEEEKLVEVKKPEGDEYGSEYSNGISVTNGRHALNGTIDPKQELQMQSKSDDQENGTEGETPAEESVMPPPFESKESVDFKLTLLEMYLARVSKRIESKNLMFERGLLEYKKMQAQEKKRSKEEKDILTRMRPLAKLQTAEDFENLVEGLLYEALLRKRIQELQYYRRIGLTAASDIDRYEQDALRRTQAKVTLQSLPSEKWNLRPEHRNSLGPDARRSSYADGTGPTSGGSLFRKQPAPLNLANSPSLHLLTKPEQTLCSTLRILPKPYLVIKDTIIREYARRNGNLRRREARDLVKIDVKKSAKIWDFLVHAGYLKPPLPERPPNPIPASTNAADTGVPRPNGTAVMLPSAETPLPTPTPTSLSLPTSTSHVPIARPVETPVPPWQPA